MALIFNTFKTLINEYLDGKKGLRVITVKVAVNKALNPQSAPNTSKRCQDVIWVVGLAQVLCDQILMLLCCELM